MGTTKHDGSGIASRRPTRVLPALPEGNGQLMRVVGGTDARGHGTAFAIRDVGPYLLVGDARGIMGPGQPPFGDHPHAGLIAVSHVPDGGPWESRANVPGSEVIPFAAGDVLMTFAGRGIVHDETTVGDGEHHMLQIILRLPTAMRDAPASVGRWRPPQMVSGVTCLFDGERLRDVSIEAAAYHVRLPAGQSVELTLHDAHRTGFVYARNGSVEVSGVPLQPMDVAVLGAQGKLLTLSAVDDDCECLIGVGAPIEEPWAKLLGHNGFVVAADEAGAAALLDRYGKLRARFGRGER